MSPDQSFIAAVAFAGVHKHMLHRPIPNSRLLRRNYTNPGFCDVRRAGM